MNIGLGNRNTVSAELNVEAEAVVGRGEPPPPYTVSVDTSRQPVINQTIIIQPNLKTGPLLYSCPECQNTVLTQVKHVNTKKTHLLAGFICGLTCWCLICCLGALPYIIPACKKTEHYCPNCNSILGSYSKI